MAAVMRYDGMFAARPAPAKPAGSKPSTPTAATPSSAGHIDAAITGTKRAEIVASQQVIDHAIRSVAVAGERNPEAASTIRKQVEKRVAKHFATHDTYIDKDGTAYLATFSDGVIHLERSQEHGTQIAGRDAATEVRIAQSLSGARSTTVTATTKTATSAQPQIMHQVRVTSAADGRITGHATSELIQSNDGKGTTASQRVDRTYSGSGGLTNETITETARTPTESMASTQRTDFSLDGHIAHRTASSTITEPHHTRAQRTEQSFRSDGSMKTDETTIDDHRDAVAGSRQRDSQKQTDTHTSIITHVDREGLRTSSHATTETTTPNGTQSDVTETSFRHGAPIKIHTESTSTSTSIDNDGTEIHATSRRVTDVDAGGAALKFDTETGAPVNARVRGTIDASTTIIDGTDATQRQILDQRGMITEAGTTWTGLRLTTQDRNSDGSIYTQDAFDYGQDKLDANGMPKVNGDGDSVDGTRVDSMHVDHRSWWNRNKHMISSGLSIVGGVLSVIPLGVTQVVGGAMMVAGGAIALSDDLPALIDHPSWTGALAVGLDTVGMVAGGSGVLSKFAKGTMIATDIATGTEAAVAVRGTQVLTAGITDLNAAARGVRAAEMVLNTAAVQLGTTYALSSQAYALGSKAWNEGLDSLSAEEILGALGTAATFGVSHYMAYHGSRINVGEHVPAVESTGSKSGSVTSPTPRGEYIVPKDVITEITTPERSLQHGYKHAPDFGIEVRRNADGKVLSPSKAEQGALESAIRAHIDAPETIAIRGTFKPKSGSATPQQAIIFVDPATRNMVAVDAGGTMLAAYRLHPGQIEHLYGHGSVGHTPRKSLEANSALRTASAEAPQSRAGDAVRAVRDNASRGWDAFATRPAIFTAVEGVRNIASRVGRRVDEPALAPEHASSGDVTFTSPRRQLGRREAEITDINQGQLGDCYVHAAMGAYALKDPDAVAALVRRKRGGIEVRLENGVRIKMSRKLPTRDGQLVYGAYGPNAPLWSAYVEKAYAITKGGYSTIGNGGWPSDVLAFLTGTKAEVAVGNHRPFGDIIATADAASRMTVGTKPTSGSGASADVAARIAERGLYGNHAYTVSRVFTDVDGVRMVELVNPWGFKHPKPVPLEDLDMIASGITVNSQLIRRPFA